MTKSNYNEEIEIGDDLEQEWMTQPSRYIQYSELYADAVQERDLAKNDVEIIYAQLDSKIRLNWEKYFDKKPTDAGIKQYILTKSKYKKAQIRLIKATRQMNLMCGVKTAFEHRKHALANMVTLLISGFHSEPSRKDKRNSELKRRRERERIVDKKMKDRKKSNRKK